MTSSATPGASTVASVETRVSTVCTPGISAIFSFNRSGARRAVAKTSAKR